MARAVARRPRAAALPGWVAPQLTQLVDAAPDGDAWLHEIKFDGYRMHARLDRGTVRLLTRTGLDWTQKYPSIAEAVSSLGVQARIAQRPDILDQRRETVEHPFGSIKQWMNQGAFLMRGLEKVRGEFSLTALACNLRRVLNLVDLPKLIAALPTKSHACRRFAPAGRTCDRIQTY